MLVIAMEGKLLRSWDLEKSMFMMMMKKRGKLENRKDDGKDKIKIIRSFNIEWKEMGKKEEEKRKKVFY
jgi:hypothetical protein